MCHFTLAADHEPDNQPQILLCGRCKALFATLSQWHFASSSAHAPRNRMAIAGKPSSNRMAIAEGPTQSPGKGIKADDPAPKSPYCILAQINRLRQTQ